MLFLYIAGLLVSLGFLLRFIINDHKHHKRFQANLVYQKRLDDLLVELFQHQPPTTDNKKLLLIQNLDVLIQSLKQSAAFGAGLLDSASSAKAAINNTFRY